MALVQATNPLVGVLSTRDLAAADAGNFYVACNPTPGTGVITGTPVAFTETSPYIVVYNSGNLNIYPVHLRLKSVIAGASATQLNYTHTIDTGNRFTSGGGAATINNTNMLSTNKSSAVINVGALVATAATSSRRLLGNQSARPGLIDIVGDSVEFSYGSPVLAIPPSEVTATGINIVKAVAPVVIGPGQSYLFYVWKLTTFATGITYEYELGYIER